MDRNIKPIPDNVTHWAQLKDSEYLGHWDLPEGGKQVKVTIDQFKLEEVINPANKKKEWKSVISFRGAKKRMILNTTNMKAIASWHGSNPRDWFGKDILIFRTTTKLKKEEVECIRVVQNNKKAVEDRSAAAAQAAE